VLARWRADPLGNDRTQIGPPIPKSALGGKPQRKEQPRLRLQRRERRTELFAPRTLFDFFLGADLLADFVAAAFFTTGSVTAAARAVGG